MKPNLYDIFFFIVIINMATLCQRLQDRGSKICFEFVYQKSLCLGASVMRTLFTKSDLIGSYLGASKDTYNL